MGKGRSATLLLTSLEAGAVPIVPLMMTMLTGEEAAMFVYLKVDTLLVLNKAGMGAMISSFNCRCCDGRGRVGVVFAINDSHIM